MSNKEIKFFNGSTFETTDQEVKSYVKDSTDILNKSQRDICENKKIVTFDVVSRYTNIPHNLGKEDGQTHSNNSSVIC